MYTGSLPIDICMGSIKLNSFSIHHPWISDDIRHRLAPGPGSPVSTGHSISISILYFYTGTYCYRRPWPWYLGSIDIRTVLVVLHVASYARITVLLLNAGQAACVRAVMISREAGFALQQQQLLLVLETY